MTSPLEKALTYKYTGIYPQDRQAPTSEYASSCIDIDTLAPEAPQKALTVAKPIKLSGALIALTGIIGVATAMFDPGLIRGLLKHAQGIGHVIRGLF